MEDLDNIYEELQALTKTEPAPTTTTIPDSVILRETIICHLRDSLERSYRGMCEVEGITDRIYLSFKCGLDKMNCNYKNTGLIRNSDISQIDLTGNVQYPGDPVWYWLALTINI